MKTTRKWFSIGLFLIISTLLGLIVVQYSLQKVPKLISQVEIQPVVKNEKFSIVKKKRLIPDNVTKDQCSNGNGRSLNIHLFILKSAEMQYTLNEEILQSYAHLHGYQMKILMAENFIQKNDKSPFHQILLGKYKRSRADLIKTMKSVVIQETMKEMQDKSSECALTETWAVFLDADIIISSPFRRVEEIIEAAHRNYVGDNNKKISNCEVIAQFSPTTLNTGVLLFKVSPKSLRIAENWVQLTIQSLKSNLEWQHEQGWFGYLYLLSIEQFLNENYFAQKNVTTTQPFSLPFYCGNPFLPLAKGIILDLRQKPIIYIRTMCLIHSLHLLDAFPNPSHYYEGFPICPLSGFHIHEQFNLHDWHGNEEFLNIPFPLSILPDHHGSKMNQNKKKQLQNITLYSMDISTVPPTSKIIHSLWNQNQFEKKCPTNNNSCKKFFPIFYHGKNETILKTIIHSFHEQIKLFEQEQQKPHIYNISDYSKVFSQMLSSQRTEEEQQPQQQSCQNYISSFLSKDIERNPAEWKNQWMIFSDWIRNYQLFENDFRRDFHSFHSPV